jgi:putative transposase
VPWPRASSPPLRAELVGHERYPTREPAEASIGDYIGRFYNARRRHPYLGYLSPLEFELKAQVAAFAA